MFGNKNSAIPYVRIGGVDRQSVLTSNANGNTPVKEIGVDANGNLVFSVDWETFKSVLDLKYSQFKSNDDDQNDTWETEKSVSMRASGTLEDGTAKETGVIVSQEYSAMVSASMKDDTSSVSQIAVTSNDATIHSTDGTSTTQLFVTPTGALVNGKTIAVKSDIPKTLNGKTLVADGDTTVYGTDITLASDNTGNLTEAIINANVRIDNLTTTVDGKADTSDLANYLPLSGGNLTGSLGIKSSDGGSTILSYISNEDIPLYLLSYSYYYNAFKIGNYGVPIYLIGSETRPKYETSTTEDGGVDIALLSDVPSVEQSTGTSTTATMSQKTITDNLNGKVNYSDILQANGTSTSKVMSQNAITTALKGKINTSGTTGGNTSGGLTLTAGHLYRIWVIMGSAQLSCLVKMPSTMVEQYWFLGMNIYNHYCRLHISSAGVVTYQYANVGNTNWTDNNSVYIYYEDFNS